LTESDSTKWCCRCGEFKSFSAFHRDRAMPQGLRSHCKACRKNRPPGPPKAKPPKVLNISETGVAWLAGLLEGEGYFKLRTFVNDYGEYGYPNIRMNMTDEDVVRRAQRVSGVGTVHGPSKPRVAHHKPQWTWAVSRCREAMALMELILPYMGQRRTEQINLARELFRQYE
jgi:hypothetical protein